MPSLSSLLSVKSAIRLSGIVAIVVGAPMVVAPALAVKFFLGPRPEARPEEKKALSVTMLSSGISIFSAGMHALLSPAKVSVLAACASLEGMYSVYHSCMRGCGQWKKAEGRMWVNTTFLVATWMVFLTQVVALSCGDREEKEKEKVIS